MMERLTQEVSRKRTLGAAGAEAGKDRLQLLALRMARACRLVVRY